MYINYLSFINSITDHIQTIHLKHTLLTKHIKYYLFPQHENSSSIDQLCITNCGIFSILILSMYLHMVE